MSTPQEDVSVFSSLCSIGWRPLLLTGFVLDWLRGHFSSAASIEDSSLANTLWKADNTTNILIESITRWKPELTEKRPGIVVKRNDIHVQRMGINDKMMGYNPVDGFEYYATYLIGSHSIICLGREGAEVEKLATEVYRELIEFAPKYRELLQFHKLLVSGIGAIFKVKESRETFGVPVTINYAFEEGWKIIPQAPVLKKIDLAVFQP